ncbi:polysaccharide deacetylase family protein [Shouchella lonarensis]|uniref:Polysaccharide deacetylase family sporulation protein PdaB n=1 Tax=Shouchella lonarensis TaxID=1464122 RepID=A0A1G6HDM9_9BACI|nr:polysaccharide deacetylase family protein [Shouchella lonarensis]SDB92198.1 polysaccharide deacetylase family sporulation protein PdaB [Shouchella lonarensis]
MQKKLLMMFIIVIVMATVSACNFLSENATEVMKEGEGEDLEIRDELDPNGKYVALTFDDGPHPTVTPSVLETLKDHEVPATFYMVGSQVSQHPDLAKAVTEDGHEVGNHTVNHPNMTKMSLADARQEIEQTNTSIKEATGKEPKTIRPPYGAHNEDVLNLFQDMEMPAILWSVDSFDWKSNAETVKKEVMKQIHDGSIVLMHDIHESTANALPRLLTKLKEEDYEFVTVSELLSLKTGADVGPYYMQ